MKTDKFSLFDFCKKRAGKLQIYGPETIDEEGRVIPFIEQAAIITHYLHLKHFETDISYAEQAEKLIALWSDILAKEYGEPIVFIA